VRDEYRLQLLPEELQKGSVTVRIFYEGKCFTPGEYIGELCVEDLANQNYQRRIHLATLHVKRQSVDVEISTGFANATGKLLLTAHSNHCGDLRIMGYKTLK
jgi:hypothetical protein